MYKLYLSGAKGLRYLNETFVFATRTELDAALEFIRQNYKDLDAEVVEFQFDTVQSLKDYIA